MWLISIQASQAVAHTLLEALESFSDSVSILEDIRDPAVWHIQALTTIRPSQDELETLLTEIAGLSNPMLTIEELIDKDWVAENQKTFTPLTIGPFYIHDAQHQESPPPDKICLQIDASTAFGTGHHGTTQGCLEALSFLKTQGEKFKNIIDIGTGTAILAMAAAKLFDMPVLATDNDAEAVRKSSENLIVNDCQSDVTLVYAEGLNHPDLASHQPFDLIIANILANTLIELSFSIAQATRKGSILILSGLLNEQAESVLTAFQTYHFRLQKSIIHEEWAALILIKA